MQPESGDMIEAEKCDRSQKSGYATGIGHTIGVVSSDRSQAYDQSRAYDQSGDIPAL
jgi:hypothetical protein